MNLNDVEAGGFFVLRTPLLPWDEILAWSEGLEACSALATAADLEQALGADRVRLRARLQALVDRADVREAIFIASPDLEESIETWRSAPDSDRGQRAERALVRYLTRMAGRATPFGLFAGCSIGTIGNATRLVLADRRAVRRHTRLDMDYLFNLEDTLARDPEFRLRLRYTPNSSAYRLAGRIRYVESRVNGTTRTYHLVSAESTEALERVLEHAANGATRDELAAILVRDDVTRADAEAYIDEIIASQLLVTTATVPVTGSASRRTIATELEQQSFRHIDTDVLTMAVESLESIDAAGPGVAPDRYRAVIHGLERLGAPIDRSKLFQVDLMKTGGNATLGPLVLEEITRGIALLHSFGQRGRRSDLQRFREEFMHRYERREVPLVQVLDDESGIGFGSANDPAPVLQGIDVPRPVDNGAAWTDGDTFLLTKLSSALTSSSAEIVLHAGDSERLARGRDVLPLADAFSVFASIAARSAAALANGDFLLHLQGVDGPSGARLLGRFCHADALLQQHVMAHLRAEEAHDPDAILAEIAHLPAGRVGNVLLRPVLRQYEIPYLARSGAPPDCQIPVADLTVSVVDGRVVLRSRRLDRRVVPRLTSAHNYSDGLPIYRFLCALQHQDVAGGLHFDWGPLADAPFLPRVVSGRLVLSLMRWRVEKEELEPLGRERGASRFRMVQAWRLERRLPRWVILADGDNTLPVDLENTLSVESFVHLVKGREAVTLHELFPSADQLCTVGPEGRFVHELIVPFVRASRAPSHVRRPDAERPVVLTSAAAASAPRRFLPGSEWLFVKVYTGPTTADHILRDIVGPIVREAIASGAADRWFFIRYADPDFHLRLRVHGRPAALQRRVWPVIQSALEPLLEDGHLRRVTIDSYEREVERYGGVGGIGLAEQVFHIDSDAALEILERVTPGDGGLDERWRLALCGMDTLLEAFGFDLDTRAAVVAVKSPPNSPAAQTLHRQQGERFRKERAGLEALFQRQLPDDDPLKPSLDVLRVRNERLRPVLAELRARDAGRRLTMSCREMAASYLHMHANRMLRSIDSPQQEAVLYDFLHRLYTSRLARGDRHGAPSTCGKRLASTC